MRRERHLMVVGTALLSLFAGQALAKGPGAKTVEVDCSKGESVAAVLEERADQNDPLTIEITGMCQEHIVIERDNVTLMGADPEQDGIVGPTADASVKALIEVRAKQVRLENLAITGQKISGIQATGLRADDLAELELVNCRLVDNDVGGHFSTGAFVIFRSSEIAANGILGLRAQREAWVRCYGCSIHDNGAWAVESRDGANVYLYNSTVDEPQGGVLVFMTGFAAAVNTSVTAGTQALYSGEQGDINWFGGSVSGEIRVDWKAFLYLQGVTQTANPGENYVGEGSTLSAYHSTLSGTTRVLGFADGELIGTSSIGDLVCERGGQFYCDPAVTKTSSTCALCP